MRYHSLPCVRLLPPPPLRPRPPCPQGPTWTRVAATVRPSTATSPSRTINLTNPVQWERGDRIVLVTTYWKGAPGWGAWGVHFRGGGGQLPISDAM